jgi:tetratricopeptide (TPR) repeat protein
VGGRQVSAGQSWQSSGATPTWKADPLGVEAGQATDERKAGGSRNTTAAKVAREAAVRLHVQSGPLKSVRVEVTPLAVAGEDPTATSAPAPAKDGKASPRPLAPEGARGSVAVLDADADPQESEAERQARAARLTELRSLVIKGQADLALEVIKKTEGVPYDGDLLWVYADALRAVGRYLDAALAYEAAARHLKGQDRGRVTYAAGVLWMDELGRPERALKGLNTAWMDAAPSEIRERATLLRVDALMALGRKDDAHDIAGRYLEREPESKTSERMRKILGW